MALGVVDVDVARERDPEQGERLLAMDQADHGGVPLGRDHPHHPPPGRGQHVLLKHRLE
jgi:hypothetical protein